MNYKIKYTKHSIKFLDKLSKTNNELCLALTNSIEKIKKNPHNFKPLHGKYDGFCQVRKGQYRIIFKIEGDIIRIERIGKRSNIYK